MWHVGCLKAPTMTGQITLIFQYSLQGAPLQAPGRMLGVLVGRSRPACANRRGGAGRPAPEAAHLPSVGRDGGRGRRGPKGVVHCAPTASQVRPSVGGRGGGGWIRKAGHCKARGESKAKAFRSTPTIAGTSHPDLPSCRPRLDNHAPHAPLPPPPHTHTLPGARGLKVAAGRGQGPRANSREDGLVKTVVTVPKTMCQMKTLTNSS